VRDDDVEMSGPRRRPAAPAIALAIALICVGACVPQPIGRASFSPATSTGPPPTPIPTPAPTGPTPSPSFVRPTPTPLPTFLSYVVKSGDTLQSIADAHKTTVLSLAFWNRTTYPSLDPDSPDYEPDRIAIGWVLRLVPETEIDEDETFPY
jgi:LysM domain